MLLNWLSQDDYTAKLYKKVEAAQPSTTSWFTATPKVKDWLAGGKRTLYCLGNLGTGKSVLAASLIKMLQQKSQPCEAVVYSFFEPNERQTLADQIRRFLRQLLQQRDYIASDEVPESLWELYAITGKDYEATRRYTDHLLEEFIRCVRCLSRVFVVIDGLDECKEHVGAELLWRFKSGWGTDNISVIYFSRPMPLVLHEVGPDETLTITVPEVVLKEYVQTSLTKAAPPG